MQRIISRAVVAVLAAFAILTPTGYAMTDQGNTTPAAEMHDAQLQYVNPPEPSSAPDERQVLASRGQGAPVAPEKHDAQLQDVVGGGTDVVAYGTDVSAPDQQASVSGSAGEGSAKGPDSLADDGGLSTAAISALIALVAMSGIAVAAVASRHTRVRI